MPDPSRSDIATTIAAADASAAGSAYGYPRVSAAPPDYILTSGVHYFAGKLHRLYESADRTAGVWVLNATEGDWLFDETQEKWVRPTAGSM